jgi:hypothetical protein
MAHTITDRLLEDYLKCHSKAYLRVHGRAGEANEYLALCSLLDARHRADASLWLSTPTTTGGVRSVFEICSEGLDCFPDGNSRSARHGPRALAVV